MIGGEETEACNRPSRMLTQLSREVTQIHTNTQIHKIQYKTQTYTHKEGDTNTWNYTNTQTHTQELIAVPIENYTIAAPIGKLIAAPI